MKKLFLFNMPLPSLTAVFSILFLLYVVHSIYTLSLLFVAPKCFPGQTCFQYYLNDKPELQMVAFSSIKIRPSVGDSNLVEVIKNFDYSLATETVLTIKVPRETRNNGSMYLHIFVLPRKHKVTEWQHVQSDIDKIYSTIKLTHYQVPASSTYQLLTGDAQKKQVRPVSHFKSTVGVKILTGITSFPQTGIPGELHSLISLSKDGKILPLIHHDLLNDRLRNLVEIEKTTDVLNTTLYYSTISFGQLRLMLHMQSAFRSLMSYGFSDKDLDEVKGIFADTHVYLLGATIFISAMHLLFDFLALKNDVNFWRTRKTLAGLSGRAVIWRAFSQVIIFLYLFDEDTSLLVLGPAGISTLIELWKVTKVIPVDWKGFRLKPVTLTKAEHNTREFDKESMRYLSYLFYPLCIGAAGYSLLYESHKSWYSWCIHSMVNGVYAFGFMFMLPQLFINYKLKSVAHLPWRSFMYKAFNTFIDDVFAFIITMPTAHRLACFRDDFVFVIYLYQRWLYPVDKTRLDEGATIEGEVEEVDNKSKKTK
uniref:Lipid scramblase CLPTM1L n=2 Tax=Clastoptera arizonana TaxID=38151 RepID=A0A1B6EGB7_9HEMI